MEQRKKPSAAKAAKAAKQDDCIIAVGLMGISDLDATDSLDRPITAASSPSGALSACTIPMSLISSATLLRSLKDEPRL
jgi:hypothetical protein